MTNGKSPAGPNPLNCKPSQPRLTGLQRGYDQLHAGNQYVWQQTTGGVTTIPVPDADTLKRLTAISADNNGFREVPSADETKLMAATAASASST